MKKDQFTIFSLYKRFFAFLEAGSNYTWNAFCDIYTSSAPDFFEAYFNAFTYDKSALISRIDAIAFNHYTHLRTLVRENPPEEIAIHTLRRCSAYMPLNHVSVYLMVGFFSADGFTLTVNGVPVIGIGMERLHNLSYLDLLIAHEYAHSVRIRSGFHSTDIRTSLINEGMATHFSKTVFPDRTLPEHLFLSNEEFNSLLAQREELLDRSLGSLNSGKTLTIAGFRRIRQFLGYYLINQYRKRHEPLPLHELLGVNGKAFFPDDD